MSWDPIVLVHKESRYLSVLVLPAAILISIALRRWMRSSHGLSRALVLALLLVVLGHGLGRTARTVSVYRSKIEKFRRVAESIRSARPSAVSFPHFRWAIRANYFTDFSDGYRAYAPPRSPANFRIPAVSDEPRTGEWVIMDPGYFGSTGDWRLSHDPLPEWMTSPPEEWVRRFDTGSTYILSVSEEGDP